MPAGLLILCICDHASSLHAARRGALVVHLMPLGRSLGRLDCEMFVRTKLYAEANHFSVPALCSREHYGPPLLQFYEVRGLGMAD